MNQIDTHFTVMGCEARIRLESTRPQDELWELAGKIKRLFQAYDNALSRFHPESELSRFNRRTETVFPASSFLQELARAARHAGDLSAGLVDATLIAQIQQQGYTTSLAGKASVDLQTALAHAPKRAPAQPAQTQHFRSLMVSGQGEVLAPLGVQLDSGGLGKGLVVDRAAALLPQDVRFAVSCGGDLRVGERSRFPWQVGVADAYNSQQEVHRLSLWAGGVATSGLNTRLWQREDGSYVHHLLDPSTGKPAWTGLLAVTALASTACEAEILAKQAFLLGPRGAKRLLRTHGGVLQHEDGRVDIVEPLRLTISSHTGITLQRSLFPFPLRPHISGVNR